jgi:hypothetical protein
MLIQPYFPSPALLTPSATLAAPSSTPFVTYLIPSPTGFPVLPVTPLTVSPSPRPAAPTTPPAVFKTPLTPFLEKYVSGIESLGLFAYPTVDVTQVTPEETPPLLLDIPVFGFEAEDKLCTGLKRII